MSETAAASADSGEAQTPESNTPAAGSLDALPAEFAWVNDVVKKAREGEAKYRTRAREFADDDTYEAAKSALAKLREIEDSQKSEATKEREAREAAEAAAKEAQGALARERAARRHGLSDDAMEFLTGATDEEIEERAKRLAEMTAAKTPQRRPDPSQGSTAGAGAPASAADQFAQAVESWLS